MKGIGKRGEAKEEAESVVERKDWDDGHSTRCVVSFSCPLREVTRSSPDDSGGLVPLDRPSRVGVYEGVGDG